MKTENVLRCVRSEHGENMIVRLSYVNIFVKLVKIFRRKFWDDAKASYRSPFKLNEMLPCVCSGHVRVPH